MYSDTLKLIFTYGIATLVIVGGGAMLYYTTDENLQLVLAGFIGAAIQFVFNRETQTQTARQTERAIIGTNLQGPVA